MNTGLWKLSKMPGYTLYSRGLKHVTRGPNFLLAARSPHMTVFVQYYFISLISVFMSYTDLTGFNHFFHEAPHVLTMFWNITVKQKLYISELASRFHSRDMYRYGVGILTSNTIQKLHTYKIWGMPHSNAIFECHISCNFVQTTPPLLPSSLSWPLRY